MRLRLVFRARSNLLWFCDGYRIQGYVRIRVKYEGQMAAIVILEGINGDKWRKYVHGR